MAGCFDPDLQSARYIVQPIPTVGVGAGLQGRAGKICTLASPMGLPKLSRTRPVRVPCPGGELPPVAAHQTRFRAHDVDDVVRGDLKVPAAGADLDRTGPEPALQHGAVRQPDGIVFVRSNVLERDFDASPVTRRTSACHRDLAVQDGSIPQPDAHLAFG